MKKITVLGAGNGGQALSGHLASMGHSVTLFEHPDFGEKIDVIRRQGGIEIDGAIKCTGKLELATTDIRRAVENADILYLAAPTFAQRPILEMAIPYLKDDQIIVLIPGNFGSLVLKKMLRDRNVTKNIRIAETDTLPYACRQREAGIIDVWGMKNYISMAALPGKDISGIISEIQDFFPLPLVEAPNALAIGFYNTNMILHCPTVIMNAGRIESDRNGFQFYQDGMSESVCRVMEAMDAERIAVGSRLNLELLSTMADMKQLYKIPGNTLREAIVNNPTYGGHGMDSPSSVNHRYLTEDVPYLLVPVSEFGKLLGIPTPVIDSIILLAGIVNGRNYFKTGLSIEDMGLEKMNAGEMIEYVNGR